MTKLMSNIDVEYYRWYYDLNGSGRMHYRFDPFTGIIKKSTYMERNELGETFYISNSEYPIYNVYGQYVGMYFNGNFMGPITVSDLMSRNSRDRVTTTPWEQMKKVLEPKTDVSVEEKTNERVVIGCEYTHNGITKHDTCRTCIFKPQDSHCDEFAHTFRITLIYDE